MAMKTVPTGVISLDSLIGGGFPAGALVLLRGETGAGHKEFLMSSATMTHAIKKGLIKPAEPNVMLPNEVWWVTFTRSPDDLLTEVSMSFEHDLHDLFREGVKFKDFSEDYFRASPVPLEWVSEEAREEREREKLEGLTKAFAGVHRAVAAPAIKPKTALESLADFLTANASNNIVVLYTLSDLARLYSDSESKWYDFTLFLRGLQRAAKKWNGIIYAPMTARLLDERKEEEISACVDGVINFGWEAAGPTKRRRVMFFQKFRGLLPHLGGAVILAQNDKSVMYSPPKNLITVTDEGMAGDNLRMVVNYRMLRGLTGVSRTMATMGTLDFYMPGGPKLTVDNRHTDKVEVVILSDYPQAWRGYFDDFARDINRDYGANVGSVDASKIDEGEVKLVIAGKGPTGVNDLYYYETVAEYEVV